MKKITKIELKSLFLVVILVGIGIYFFLHDYERRNIKLNDNNIQIIASETEWTNKKIELTVKYTGSREHIKEYSFDGGKTWSRSNMYVVEKNDIVDIKVKDINNNIYSKKHNVTNIDSDGPVILTDTDIQVNINSKVDLNQYVTVYDEGIGLRDKIVLTPNTIDTSKVGMQTIQVYAIDKLANKTITSFNVYVGTNVPIPSPKNISLDKSLIIISPSEELVLNAQLSPKYINKKISWISKDPTIVSVDNNGKITGLKEGNSVITAQTENGLKSTCYVIVK